MKYLLSTNIEKFSANTVTFFVVHLTKKQKLFRQHGHRKGNQFEFGKTITYECLPGFETHENEILEFICDETGYFLPITNRSISYSEIRFPVCLPVSCGLPPLVLNGMVTNESYFVERVFQV